MQGKCPAAATCSGDELAVSRMLIRSGWRCCRSDESLSQTGLSCRSVWYFHSLVLMRALSGMNEMEKGKESTTYPAKRTSRPKEIEFFDELGMTYRMRQRGCAQHDWTKANAHVHSALRKTCLASKKAFYYIVAWRITKMEASSRRT